MKVGGTPTKLQVSYGATYNVPPERCVPTDTAIEESEEKLTMHRNGVVSVVGKCNLRITSPQNQKFSKVPF